MLDALTRPSLRVSHLKMAHQERTLLSDMSEWNNPHAAGLSQLTDTHTVSVRNKVLSPPPDDVTFLNLFHKFCILTVSSPLCDVLAV